MSLNIVGGGRNLAGFAVAVLLGMIPETAMAQSIEGTATYRERMALPPGAVFAAVLEDVSRADAPAETIARTRVEPAGIPPIAFTLDYDPAKIQPNHRYVVRARIVLDDKLMFVADAGAPVITQGNPTSVSIMLRRVAAGTTGTADPAIAGPLEGTHWRATELAGKPTPSLDSNREPHLVFQADGRVSGADGCNRITGSYQLRGDADRTWSGTATCSLR